MFRSLVVRYQNSTFRKSMTWEEATAVNGFRLTRLYRFRGKSMEFLRYSLKGLPHISFGALRFWAMVGLGG
jgi:hypothetical protein